MNFKEYVTRAFCESGVPSSKRFMGGIGFASSIGIVIGLAIGGGATETVKDLVDSVLYVSAALIGLSTVVRPFTRTGPVKKDDSDVNSK